MSVENIVRDRVQKFKDNQERLIKEDKSHNSTSLFGGFLNGTNYSDWRKDNKVFSDGYATGLEEGLRDSFNTDKLVNSMNLENRRHKEFYEKFLTLASEYNCRFNFHPLYGMMLEDIQ